MLATALATAVALIAAVPAQAARSYRFKLDLSVYQESDWTLRWAFPRECRYGRYEYSGEGNGYLSARIRGARITFPGTGLLQSTQFRARGFAVNDGEWKGPTPFGEPSRCVSREPPTEDTSGCNPLVRRRGTARSALLVARGRLYLLGGFYRDGGNRVACPDPTYYTGAVHGGGPQGRGDLDRLIRNPRVRSIQLSVSRTRRFGLADFRDPAGANTRALAGSGTGKARWSVKLTRIR